MSRKLKTDDLQGLFNKNCQSEEFTDELEVRKIEK